jgi:hypothetical protein
VQVGDERVPRVQELDLVGLRLLDLDDQPGVGEHRLGVVDDPRALGGVVAIFEGEAVPGAALHEHVVAAIGQLTRTGGRQYHAVLVGFDLGANADLQVVS